MTTPATFTQVILFTDHDGRARWREEAIALTEGKPQAMLSPLRPSAGSLTINGQAPWRLSATGLRNLRAALFLAPQVPPLPAHRIPEPPVPSRRRADRLSFQSPSEHTTSDRSGSTAQNTPRIPEGPRMQLSQR